VLVGGDGYPKLYIDGEEPKRYGETYTFDVELTAEEIRLHYESRK
jgi:hypothetical protein